MKDTFLKSLYKRRGGIKLGTGRVLSAYNEIKTKEIKSYHVAGTNGKGTTVYAISKLLKDEGYNVGSFISPHIVNYNERILLNGKNISDESTERIYNWLSENTSNFEDLSFFEITFLIAWRYFEENSVDRAVFETGLGGRLDATNVISHPKVSVITSIGLDHTHILGKTIEQIALEKLGIVGKKDITIFADIEEPLLSFMTKVAKEKESSKIIKYSNNIKIIPPKSFLSDKQIINLKAAATAFIYGEKSSKKEFDFSKLKLPARFQIIDDKYILDVAHNPQAIDSLKNQLKIKYGKVSIIFGAMKDKDITTVLKELNEVTDKFYFIYLDNNGERGATVEEMVKKAPKEIKEKIVFTKNTEETLEKASKDLNKVAVTGSFFTIEKFLKWYKHD